MRALLYKDWDQLEVTELRDPVPKPDEVLVKVDACGICGSELETFKSRSTRRQPPLVMGHEFCGQIVQLGTEVTSFEVGQKVVANAVVGCGVCDYCTSGRQYLCEKRQVFGMHRPGAFAEYVAVPERALLDWPSDLTSTSACLAEPLGNAVHVVRKVASMKPERVLVIGAGPIGLFCMQAFKVMLDCDVVVSDLLAGRRAIAASRGATTTIDPVEQNVSEVLPDHWNGLIADIAVDAVGSAETKRVSLRSVRTGGTAVWVGLHENSITMDSYDVTLGEKSIVGTYGASGEDMQTALNLLSSGTVDSESWTTDVRLNESAEMFRSLVDGKTETIKAVVTP